MHGDEHETQPRGTCPATGPHEAHCYDLRAAAIRAAEDAAAEKARAEECDFVLSEIDLAQGALIGLPGGDVPIRILDRLAARIRARSQRTEEAAGILPRRGRVHSRR